MIDPKTGEVCAAELFVATSCQRRASGTTSRRRRASGTTGASSYTYAEATRTQSLPDWIASHERAFAFFGGVPAQVVPDNLKSGVTKACFYDPEINRTYADLAAHYDTAFASGLEPVAPSLAHCRRGLTSRKSEPLCAIGSRTMANAKVEAAVQLAERWIIAVKDAPSALLAAAAQSAVLLHRRGERGHPAAAGGAQRQGLPSPRCQPPGVV